MNSKNRNFKRMQNTIYSLLLASLSSLAMADGPFGLTMGMSKDEIPNIEKTDQPLKYEIEEPPTPNPIFSMYSATISEQVGLCSIMAIAAPIETNSFGQGLRDKFDQIKEALTNRYGEPETYDFLHPGSIWDEANEFMESMARGERELVAMWNSEEEPLDNQLSNIMLQSKAYNKNIGALVLQYDFNNMPECQEELSNIRGKGL